MSLANFTREYLEEALDIDGKLWRSVKALFAKPGFLTVEYWRDRRTRYVKPFRLYLLASVMLFLIPSVFPSPLRLNAHRPEGLRVGYYSTSVSSEEPEPEKPRPATAEELQEEKEMLESKGLYRKVINPSLLRLWSGGTELARERLSRTLGSTMQKTLLLLAPFFAGVLRLLYWRRRILYVEHLVFALHECSVLLLGMLALLYSVRTPWQPLFAVLAVIVAMVAHVYLAVRRAYAQSHLWSALKVAVLVASYVGLFVGGTFFTFLAATLSM
jgi:hypothetical protein